jgi:hypothetical protein
MSSHLHIGYNRPGQRYRTRHHLGQDSSIQLNAIPEERLSCNLLFKNLFLKHPLRVKFIMENFKHAVK